MPQFIFDMSLFPFWVWPKNIDVNHLAATQCPNSRDALILCLTLSQTLKENKKQFKNKLGSLETVINCEKQSNKVAV